jgi:hypothetical protein
MRDRIDLYPSQVLANKALGRLFHLAMIRVFNLLSLTAPRSAHLLRAAKHMIFLISLIILLLISYDSHSQNWELNHGLSRQVNRMISRRKCHLLCI